MAQRNDERFDGDALLNDKGEPVIEFLFRAHRCEECAYMNWKERACQHALDGDPTHDWRNCRFLPRASIQRPCVFCGAEVFEIPHRLFAQHVELVNVADGRLHAFTCARAAREERKRREEAQGRSRNNMLDAVRRVNRNFARQQRFF